MLLEIVRHMDATNIVKSDADIDQCHHVFATISLLCLLRIQKLKLRFTGISVCQGEHSRMLSFVKIYDGYGQSLLFWAMRKNVSHSSWA
jgi:hypothetical protein